MRRLLFVINRVLNNLDWIVLDLECKLGKENTK